MAKYREVANKHLKDLDIGYLALNAGMMTASRFFHLLKDEEVDEIMILNGVHPVLLAKALLEQLLQRKSRSALVITSSAMSNIGLP